MSYLNSGSRKPLGGMAKNSAWFLFVRLRVREEWQSVFKNPVCAAAL